MRAPRFPNIFYPFCFSIKLQEFFCLHKEMLNVTQFCAVTLTAGCFPDCWTALIRDAEEMKSDFKAQLHRFSSLCSTMFCCSFSEYCTSVVSVALRALNEKARSGTVIVPNETSSFCFNGNATLRVFFSKKQNTPQDVKTSWKSLLSNIIFRPASLRNWDSVADYELTQSLKVGHNLCQLLVGRPVVSPQKCTAGKIYPRMEWFFKFDIP